MTEAAAQPSIIQVPHQFQAPGSGLVLPAPPQPQHVPTMDEWQRWTLMWQSFVMVFRGGNLVVIEGHPGSGKSHQIVNFMEFATRLNTFLGPVLPGEKKNGRPVKHPGYIVLTNMLFKQRQVDGIGLENTEVGGWWLNGLPTTCAWPGEVGRQANLMNAALMPGQTVGGYPPYIWFASTFYDLIKLVSFIKNHPDPDIRNRQILMVLDEFDQFISKGNYDQFLRDFLKFRHLIRKFDLCIMLSLPNSESLPRDWRLDTKSQEVSFWLDKNMRLANTYNKEEGTKYTQKQLTFIQGDETFPPGVMLSGIMSYTKPEIECMPGDFSYDHKVSGTLKRGGLGNWETPDGFLTEEVADGTAYAFSFSHLNRCFNDTIHEMWPAIMARFFEEKEQAFMEAGQDTGDGIRFWAGMAAKDKVAELERFATFLDATGIPLDVRCLDGDALPKGFGLRKFNQVFRKRR